MKSHGYVTKVRESLNSRTSKRPKNPLPRAGGFSCPGHSQRPRQGEDLHMGLSATRNRGCYHTRPIAFGWSLCLWPQRLVLQEGGGHCPRERSQKLFRRAYHFPQNRRPGAALVFSSKEGGLLERRIKHAFSQGINILGRKA